MICGDVTTSMPVITDTLMTSEPASGGAGLPQ
jgi:hypothetical protein